MTPKKLKSNASALKRAAESAPRRPKVRKGSDIALFAIAAVSFSAVSVGAILASLPSDRYGGVTVREIDRVGEAAQLRRASCTSRSEDCDLGKDLSDLRDVRNGFYQAMSAHWAKISALTAVISALIGTIGMALVLLTLRETRRATRAAIDGQRAWIRINDCKVASFRLRAVDQKLVVDAHCKIEIENLGQTPALSVQPRFIVWLTPHENASEREYQRKDAQIILENYCHVLPGEAMFPDQKGGTGVTYGCSSKDSAHFVELPTTISDKYFHVRIAAIVTYRISSGKDCTTFQAYSVYSGRIFETALVTDTTYKNGISMMALHNIFYAD